MENNNIKVNVNSTGGGTGVPATYVTRVMKPNIPFSDQIIEDEKVKYVIRWEFDLGGEEIIMPANCLIEMDGGKLKNGTLVGTDTILVYNQEIEDILIDVILSGSWVHKNGTYNVDNETIKRDTYGVISVKERGIGTQELADEAVTNEKLDESVADNEDVHLREDGKIQFADKEYSEANYSGLGRVYLRKNVAPIGRYFDLIYTGSVTVESSTLSSRPDGIVFVTASNEFLALKNDKYYRTWTYGNAADYTNPGSYTGVFVNNTDKKVYHYTIEGLSEVTEYETGNILFQKYINKPNTIYIIQYDYNLNEETITIPEGCVLEFEGGSLGNGTIVGNGTINVQSDSICFHNIIIGTSSEFANDRVKLSWFKEDSDDVTDVLQNLLDSNITTILIDLPVVFVSHPLVISSLRKNIFGLLDSVQKKSIIRVSEDWDASDYDKNSIFIIDGDSGRNTCDFNIVGIDFYGNHEGIINPAYTFKANYAIYSRCIAGGSIDKCSFVSFIIAAIKLSSCEHFIVSNNYIAYCGSTLIGTIRKIDESNVLAFLTENEISTTNQVALLRIFDNYSVYTNYGLLLFAGTDVQVYNNCISHTSCYGIYLYYVSYIVNIFNNYFEGNGKSTFWIDANGFSGNTGGSTMCEHLLNPHLGEGNYECECGWGVFIKNTLRIRPVISLATFNPSGLANVYGNMFSTAWVRSLNTYNTDNTVVGIDALISGNIVESTIYSNNTYFSGTDNPSPIFFVTGGRIRKQPVDILGTFKMRIMDIPERWINKDWCLLDNNYRNARYLVIFPQDKEYKPCIKSAAYLKIGNAYNDLLSLAPYSKTINSVNYYSAIAVASASSKNFIFKIPFEVFNESKVVKIILYNDSTNSIGVKCELRRIVNGTEESMSQQYQYSADNTTVNSKKFYTKHYFVSAQDFTDGITDYIISVDIMSVVDTEDYGKLLFSLPLIKDIDMVSTCSDANYNDDGQRLSGNSQQRPIYPIKIGSTYFDSSLGSNLWWNGTAWVDATGATV